MVAINCFCMECTFHRIFMMISFVFVVDVVDPYHNLLLQLRVKCTAMSCDVHNLRQQQDAAEKITLKCTQTHTPNIITQLNTKNEMKNRTRFTDSISQCSVWHFVQLSVAAKNTKFDQFNCNLKLHNSFMRKRVSHRRYNVLISLDINNECSFARCTRSRNWTQCLLVYNLSLGHIIMNCQIVARTPIDISQPNIIACTVTATATTTLPSGGWLNYAQHRTTSSLSRPNEWRVGNVRMSWQFDSSTINFSFAQNNESRFGRRRKIKIGFWTRKIESKLTKVQWIGFERQQKHNRQNGFVARQTNR